MYDLGKYENIKGDWIMGTNSRFAKVERLFYILTYLSNHPYATAKTLAEHCQSSTRSIYRDIRTLEELGIHIISDGKRGYQLINKNYYGKAFLTDKEWIALTLIPLLATNFTSSNHSFQQAYLSGIEKVKNLANESYIIKFGNLLSERILFDDHTKHTDQLQIMPTIIQGIISNLTIDVTYYAMYRNETTRRKLDPYYLLPRTGQLYIIAYCHFRKEVRIFRLNRFRDCQLTNEKFQMKKDFNIDEYLANLWGVMDEGVTTTFVVKFSHNVARYVKENDYYTNIYIEEMENGDILVKTTVKSETEFLRWVRSFGMDAEVLEPKRVRKQLAKEFEEMGRRYRR